MQDEDRMGADLFPGAAHNLKSSGRRCYRHKILKLGERRGVTLLVCENVHEITVRAHQINDGGMVHHVAAVIRRNPFVVDSVFSRDRGDRCV